MISIYGSQLITVGLSIHGNRERLGHMICADVMLPLSGCRMMDFTSRRLLDAEDVVSTIGDLDMHIMIIKHSSPLIRKLETRMRVECTTQSKERARANRGTRLIRPLTGPHFGLRCTNSQSQQLPHTISFSTYYVYIVYT